MASVLKIDKKIRKRFLPILFGGLILLCPHPKAWAQVGCSVVSATFTYYADDGVWIGINGNMLSGCYTGGNWHTSNCWSGAGSGSNGTAGEGLVLTVPPSWFNANPADNVIGVVNEAIDGGANGATWLLTLVDSCGM